MAPERDHAYAHPILACATHDPSSVFSVSAFFTLNACEAADDPGDWRRRPKDRARRECRGPAAAPRVHAQSCRICGLPTVPAEYRLAPCFGELHTRSRDRAPRRSRDGLRCAILDQCTGDHLRLGRCMAGRRNAFAALQRTPLRCVTFEAPNALVVAAVEVVDLRNPISAAASANDPESPSQLRALDAQFAALPCFSSAPRQ